ncbi:MULTISPECIES: TetR/AcrR family transcriptional regulator [Methylomonas]|uniref:TetR family transcriptional regulator n=2 Tax=Methylomonas TaxID=416 RepID=A0A126T488_9GAMM|nr:MULTISPECIES: TetR/AcrR family transcriptional regulator [Methylomonas]AMK76870.1 TetR family transcriptional regulator [Methylomonas denitrificans]OAI01514.1 TetR family transcriptional regulator [Methylomonas methanica]TCV74166.1 TetR family transcriptional regulator [Methylomonas methanica]
MARNLQDHILQTASGLFYSQGIKATGVDAIVKAAGTTKMSLYKYFPSKDDLVLAHLNKSRDAMLNRILAGVELRASEPKQKLLAVFAVFDELLASPEFRGCPFINASAEFAEAANPVQLAAAEFSDAFREILAELARQAGSPDPEQLSQQLAMLISGAIVSEQMRRQSGAMRIASAAAKILIEQSLTTAG